MSDAYLGRQFWEVVCDIPAGVLDLTGFRSQVATRVICGKGDHERVRERPRLAPEVPDVRDLDPDLLAHLADYSLFYRLAWLDETREHAVESLRKSWRVCQQYPIPSLDEDDGRRTGRGKCIIPHRVHLIASSPGTRSVSPPQRPQNRCVACQPTICFALPAIPKKSSATPKKKLLRSLNTMPAGGPASVSTSTAQQACPSRSPISHLNLISSSSRLSASGTRTGPSSNTSSLSPWKANHSACSRSANGLRVVKQQGKILGRVQGRPLCSG